MRLLSPAFLAALFILSCAAILEAGIRPLPSDCTYELRIWNVAMQESVMTKTVRHPYDGVTASETDSSTGCTVCSEDQELVSIPPLPPFSVCYKVAPRIRALVGQLVSKGAPLHTIVGYHVIKSRGPVDQSGNRTGFSNHSFGTAIDINPEQNGLYDNCIRFGPECRLLRGGEWRRGAPGALDQAGDIVTAFKREGFKWGGEITGRQKDFMHFSFTGY